MFQDPLLQLYLINSVFKIYPPEKQSQPLQEFVNTPTSTLFYEMISTSGIIFIGNLFYNSLAGYNYPYLMSGVAMSLGILQTHL